MLEVISLRCYIWIITWLNKLYHLLSGWGGFTHFISFVVMRLFSNLQGSHTCDLLVLVCTSKVLFSSSSICRLIVMEFRVDFWICLSRFAKNNDSNVHRSIYQGQIDLCFLLYWILSMILYNLTYFIYDLSLLHMDNDKS